MTTLTTYLQIFGIGLGFGFIGPCFLTCAPILVTYVAGTGKGWPEALTDVILFLTGRLAAYSLLGIAAGLSAGLVRRWAGPDTAAYFGMAAGAISVGLGIAVLLDRAAPARSCRARGPVAAGRGGLFALGFLVGISPCAPLLALLFEIALMSKNALQGFAYAFSFGLGTFLAGILVVGSVAGILSVLPGRYITSPKVRTLFKIFCASLLIILGCALIIQGRHP